MSWKTLLLPLALPLLLVSMAGCSFRPFKEEPTPEAERAVLSVTNEYLVNIVRGDSKKLDGAVVWAMYLKEKGTNVSRENIYDQIIQVHAAHPSGHPIANMDVVKLDVDGDEAEVVLRKKGDPSAPEFTVKLNWVGRGWLVVSDTLLGPGGALARMEG